MASRRTILRRGWLAIAALAVASAGTAQSAATMSDLPVGLERAHPDEEVSYTLAHRFSLAEALAAVAHVRGALAGFEELTQAARSALPAATVKASPYTDTEMQTIGFRNLPGSIEGALRLQAWQLAKVRHDLAAERHRHGAATAADVEAAAAALAEADAAFRKFWAEFGIAD
jgi:hypothetical protein